MVSNDQSETARLGAAVVRLERRLEELGAALARQDGKLDLLLARTAPEAPEEGLSLRELVAQLVQVMTETHAAMQRIDQALERQRTS